MAQYIPSFLQPKQKAAERGFDGRDEAAHIDALLAVRRNLDNEHARLERERVEREAAERDRNAVTFSDAFMIYADSAKRPDSGERTLANYEQQFATFAERAKGAAAGGFSFVAAYVYVDNAKRRRRFDAGRKDAGTFVRFDDGAIFPRTRRSPGGCHIETADVAATGKRGSMRH